jgi:hypothetical protein
MKRKVIFSLTLTLSLLLSLVSLPATAQAAPPPRFRVDSGIITLGDFSQILRITVAGGAGNDAIRVRLRWMKYGTQGCSGMPPVCHHMVISQGVTPVETLGPDDALSFDINGTGVQGSGAVRVMVESNSPNVRVLGIVFDTSTQRIITTFVIEHLEDLIT